MSWFAIAARAGRPIVAANGYRRALFSGGRAALLGLGGILGLAALLALTPARADTRSDWELGPQPDGLGCVTGRVLPNGVLVSIRRARSELTYYMVFSSPNWNSLRPQANQTMPIELLFATADGDRRISDDKAVIVATASGDEAVVGIWKGKDAATFRRIAERASNVTLIGRGLEIGTYPLPGTPAFLAQLDQCVAGLKPPAGNGQ
ncbi:hypothetical protein [Novosphingobium sp.]|uniref:hypothetical protein n=1 Tax=Novosphingobium sp. TaxID=1874826 RepID=UPI0025DF3458|nr:hypothetical protein [Novosphingobium sp.]MCC6926786.1 hypothetical protein [Novosphingobium sp.]